MLAVALLGAVAVRAFGSTLRHHLAALRLPDGVRAALLDEVPSFAAAQVPAQLDEAMRRMLERTLAESLLSSFRVVMLVAAALALASAACAAATVGTEVEDGRPESPS
jgi:hypothetical protein